MFGKGRPPRCLQRGGLIAFAHSRKGLEKKTFARRREREVPESDLIDFGLKRENVFCEATGRTNHTVTKAPLLHGCCRLFPVIPLIVEIPFACCSY